MFGVDSSELLIVALVALVVIGPKDLPRVMRLVGQWVARARGMARHFRTGIDSMIRESELEEMEQKWREENERILRDHPFAAPIADPASLEAPAEVPPAEAPLVEPPPAGTDVPPAPPKPDELP